MGKYIDIQNEVGEVEYDIIRWGIFNLKDFNEDDRMDIINNDMLDEHDEYLRFWTKGDKWEEVQYVPTKGPVGARVERA